MSITGTEYAGDSFLTKVKLEIVVSHDQVSCASGLRIFYVCNIFILFIENSMLIKWQYISLKNLEQMILIYFIMEVNSNMTLATGGSCD